MNGNKEEDLPWKSLTPKQPFPKRTLVPNEPTNETQELKTSTRDLSLYENEAEVEVVNPLDVDKNDENQTETKNNIKRFCTNLKLYARELSETIEFHGLQFLFEEGLSLFERMFWWILILTSMGMCLYLIIKMHKIYMLISVIISFSSRDSLIFEVPFPALTICSQAKTNTDKFSFERLHYDLETNGRFASYEEFKAYQYFSLVCDHSLHQRNHSVFLADFVDTVENNFFETIKELSPRLDEVMYYCSYLSEVKNCSELFKPIYTSLGLCYSFNMVEWKEIFRDNAVYHPGFFETDIHGTGWLPGEKFLYDKIYTYPRRGLSAGQSNALTISLKQRKSQVGAVCTTGMGGFKATLHDPLQIPDFANHYFHISLNESVILTVKPLLLKTSDVIKGLSPRIRKCYFSDEKYLRFYKNYDQENCLAECLTNYTFKFCGCVPFHMPRDNSSPICGATKFECTYTAKRKFQLESLDEALRTRRQNAPEYFMSCDCQPLCTELKYRPKISVSEWDWHNLFHNVSTHASEEFEVSHFTMFFENDNIMTLEKIEFYGIADLMANIGGLFAFFVGASMLTFVEVIYAFSLKIICNKFIYGPWAGPASVQYKFVNGN